MSLLKKSFRLFRKAWKFLWHDDSLLSWFVSLIVLIIFVKFIFYPVVGVFFGTEFPVVAVLTWSMEHNSFFDEWWDENGLMYANFTKDEFRNSAFHNGFNQGDIMVVVGIKPGGVEEGDVIIYNDEKEEYPIIHRVIEVFEDGNSYKYRVKGDNNISPDPVFGEEKILGKAVLRVPLLGWVKIWATYIWNFIIGGF